MAMRKVLSSKYTAIFEPDLESGGYTVTIPSLPGCISEGDTFEEAMNNIQEAASLYLETMDIAEDVPVQDNVIVAPVFV
jgi:antitoxin HicB